MKIQVFYDTRGLFTTKSNHYRAEYFIYCIDGNSTSAGSKSDRSLLNKHPDKSVCMCDGGKKTKIYYILFEPSCSCHRIPITWKAYKNRTAGFFVVGEAIN
jgi:hypothetical protein